MSSIRTVRPSRRGRIVGHVDDDGRGGGGERAGGGGGGGGGEGPIADAGLEGVAGAMGSGGSAGRQAREDDEALGRAQAGGEK